MGQTQKNEVQKIPFTEWADLNYKLEGIKAEETIWKGKDGLKTMSEIYDEWQRIN